MSEIAKRKGIPQDWISEDEVANISKKADGLFIYAATTCRLFDTDEIRDGQSRQELLFLVLEDDTTDKGAPQHQIDEIYSKVLRFQSLDNWRAPVRERFYTLMKRMLGFIVTFFEPVSASSLAKFLSVEKSVVDDNLRRIHAVISVPEEGEAPLKVVHLSFRDFLLSESRAGQSESFFVTSPDQSNPAEGLTWWVDESSMHLDVFESCLRIMSQELRQDICDLVLPGLVLSDIDPKQVERHISPTLQYACSYWARHLEKLSREQSAEVGFRDGGEVEKFLREKLLFWLEAMCLIRKSSTAVHVVIQLSTLVKDSESPRLASFLQDARRFVLKYRWILENAPLQLYCSALLFSPADSELRSAFEHLIPPWITRKPRMAERQMGLVSELEGHTGPVRSIAFAPSTDLLASGSEDGVTKIWDYNTGTALYELDSSGPNYTVDISPNGRAVASASYDDKVRVTEFAEGITKTWSCGADARIVTVAFSPKDSNVLASLSESGTLQIWDIEQCRERKFSTEAPAIWASTLAWSPNGDFIAAGFGTGKNKGFVRVWGTEKGEIRTEFYGHSSCVTALAISFDGKMVASSDSRSACFWDAVTGTQDYCCGFARDGGLAFCPPKGDLVAITVEDRSVDVLHTKTWEVIGRYHCDARISQVSCSRGGNLLAGLCKDNTIRLWDVTVPRVVEYERQGYLEVVVLLPNTSERFLTCQNESFPPMRVWSAAKKEVIPGYPNILDISIFPDQEHALLTVREDCGSKSLEVWDADLVSRIEYYPDCHTAVYSQNRRLAVRLPGNHKLRIVDCTRAPFKDVATVDVDDGETSQLSPNGQILAWLSDNQTTLHLWDIAQEKHIVRYPAHVKDGHTFFSPDSAFIAFQVGESASESRVAVLEATTGEERIQVFIPDNTSRIDWTWVAQTPFIALGTPDRRITLWSTKSRKEEFTFRPTFDEDGWYLRHLNSSANGKLVAGFENKSGSTTGLLPAVVLLDPETRTELGRYHLPIVWFHTLGFTADDQYLECSGGRLPLPTGRNKWGDVGRSLWIGPQWVHRGFDNLLWLPPAYRRCQAFKFRETALLLGYRDTADMVLFLEFDLEKAPSSRRMSA